jgi:hypothetical protein
VPATFFFEGAFFVDRGTEALAAFFGCLVDFFAVLTLALFDFFAMSQILSPSGRSLQQQRFQERERSFWLLQSRHIGLVIWEAVI